MRRIIVLCLFVAALAGCTPPVRQFDLKDQPMTCEQANRCSYDALKSMGYLITAFTPASPGGRGVVKGAFDEKGSRSVTVVITCGGAGPTVDASEDGKWLGQLEFKRGFYLAFTGLAEQRKAIEAAARKQAALPLAERESQGFEVLLTPLRGLEARMDFAADLAAAGILPVRVVIHNFTATQYELDPDDIVMVRSDGERVHPLALPAALERIRQAPAPSGDTPAPDLSALSAQMKAKLFTVREMRSDSSAEGYLFYPAATYKQARVRVTETQSGETEGFMIEF